MLPSFLGCVMGGARSGRRANSSDVCGTVEHHLSVDSGVLSKANALKDDTRKLCIVKSINKSTNQVESSFHVLIDTRDPKNRFVRFFFKDSHQNVRDCVLKVTFTSSNLNPCWKILGFTCCSCEKRVKKLYFDASGVLECRTCHKLVYLSSKKSDSRISKIGYNQKALQDSILHSAEMSSSDINSLILSFKMMDRWNARQNRISRKIRRILKNAKRRRKAQGHESAGVSRVDLAL